jgi:hypothetical protein
LPAILYVADSKVFVPVCLFVCLFDSIIDHIVVVVPHRLVAMMSREQQPYSNISYDAIESHEHHNDMGEFKSESATATDTEAVVRVLSHSQSDAKQVPATMSSSAHAQMSVSMLTRQLGFGFGFDSDCDDDDANVYSGIHNLGGVDSATALRNRSASILPSNLRDSHGHISTHEHIHHASSVSASVPASAPVHPYTSATMALAGSDLTGSGSEFNYGSASSPQHISGSNTPAAAAAASTSTSTSASTSASAATASPCPVADDDMVLLRQAARSHGRSIADFKQFWLILRIILIAPLYVNAYAVVVYVSLSAHTRTWFCPFLSFCLPSPPLPSSCVLDPFSVFEVHLVSVLPLHAFHAVDTDQ